ncbi:hypothetical protein HYV10_04350, partial [Candidatus Dependentiae bacterium]|nr:hypothetical protein [Candidatus Dependentiae bacterium]
MKKNLLLGLLSILCIVYKITFSLSEEEQNIFSSNNYLIKNQSFLKLVKNSIECYSSQEVMEIALGCVFLQGFYLEMGVFKGATINFIASIKEQETIYGFDSFEGLPEAWSRDDTAMFAKGFFTIDTLPVVRDNVILVSGWFENSLPLF